MNPSQRPLLIEVILPIYNELTNLPTLLKRLDAVKRRLKSQIHLQYLFVNDGSSDGSREYLDELHSSRTDVRILHLLHNFGHGAAISAGIDHSEADAIILMDADLQDPPEAIPQLIDTWLKGSQTVVAERGSRREKNRILFSGFYYLLHKIAPTLPAINFGTHCLLDRAVVQRLKTLKEKNRYIPGLVGFSSKQVNSIVINRLERQNGKSRVGFKGLVNLAITAFLSFSNTPVRLVTLIGLSAALGATLAGSIIICVKLFTTKAIPGWASTMSVLFFGNGIQLLCIGVIGEYVARIYDEVRERPLYLVDTLLESQSQINVKKSPNPLPSYLETNLA